MRISLLLLSLSPLVAASPALVGNFSNVLFSSDDNSIYDTKRGNVVEVEVFGEARCPDTTRFIRNQLMPLFHRFSTTSRIRIIYHPFGVTRSTKCTSVQDDYSCVCQHGELECELNRLQSCVISALPDMNEHMEIVSCIQHRGSLTEAVNECLSVEPASSLLDVDFMFRCSTSALGRRLMAQHGQIQYQKVPDLYWVPWVLIDGKRERSAEHYLLETVCSRFASPRPTQCD